MRLRATLAGLATLAALMVGGPVAHADETDAPELSATLTVPETVQYDGRRPEGCVDVPVTVTLDGDGLGEVTSWEAYISGDSGDQWGYIDVRSSDAVGKTKIRFCGGTQAGAELHAYAKVYTEASESYPYDTYRYDADPAYTLVLRAPTPDLRLTVSTRAPKSDTWFTAKTCAPAGVPIRSQYTVGQSSTHIAQLLSTSEKPCLTVKYKLKLRSSKAANGTVRAWTLATKDYRAVETKVKIRTTR